MTKNEVEGREETSKGQCHVGSYFRSKLGSFFQLEKMKNRGKVRIEKDKSNSSSRRRRGKNERKMVQDLMLEKYLAE